MATETASRMVRDASPAVTQGTPAANQVSRMTVEEFRQHLTMYALYVATMGKLDYLRQENWTPLDMGPDRRHACLFWLYGFMTGDQSFSSVDPACYAYLEALWLDELKQHLAFQKSLEAKYRCESEDLQFYFRACEELRDRLANPHKLGGPSATPVQYIEETYFLGGRLGGAATERLIARKAERLLPQSRQIAERFAKAFYGNIVPAITNKDANATRNVLETLRHGGSAPGESEIVNGFEALVAILYLDADLVQEAARDTAAWQSTL